MSFGYSVGDFMTVASLTVKAIQALRDVGGSAQEYRQLSLYLSTVQRVLSEVDRLESVEGLEVTIGAIKSTALTCQHPLQEFLRSVEHYGPSLEVGYSVGFMRDTEKKLRWRAMKKAQAAERLQAQLAGYIGSINMLMGLYQIRYNALAAKNIDNRLEQLAIAVKDSRLASDDIRNEVQTARASLSQDVRTASEENSTALRTLQSSVTSVFSSFTEILGDMKQIMLNSYSANMNTYNLLVSMQTSLPSPDTGHTFFQDPMQVEDAFGRLFPVPAEYNWEMLEAVVKARFSRGPGHDFVQDGNWQLLYTNDKRYFVGEGWAGDYPAGLKLTMSMIVPKTDTKLRCPRPNCPSVRYFDALGGGKICSSCNVWFDDLPFRQVKRKELENELTEPINTANITTPQPKKTIHPDLLYLKNVRFEAPIPKGPGVFVRTVWDFKEESTTSLVLKQGDNIEVLTQLESGWWDGISNGKRGWFPYTYCTVARE